MTTTDNPPSRSAATPSSAESAAAPASIAPASEHSYPDAVASETDEDGARALLGRLNKVAAPPDLASRVPELIQRRSAGRFFAKRRFIDRVPMEWLSLVMLALLALIYAVLRMAPAVLNNN